MIRRRFTAFFILYLLLLVLGFEQKYNADASGHLKSRDFLVHLRRFITSNTSFNLFMFLPKRIQLQMEPDD